VLPVGLEDVVRRCQEAYVFFSYRETSFFGNLPHGACFWHLTEVKMTAWQLQAAWRNLTHSLARVLPA
jgi:hypothetical protein